MADTDSRAGDGVIVRVLLDSAEIYTHTISNDETSDFIATLPVMVAVGTKIDFAIDPRSSNDYNDRTKLTVVITSEPTTVPASIYNAAEIAWTAISGKTYQVQSTSSLESPAWTNFGEPVVGDGTEKSVFDKTRNADKRFYRVVEVQ